MASHASHLSSLNAILEEHDIKNGVNINKLISDVDNNQKFKNQ